MQWLSFDLPTKDRQRDTGCARFDQQKSYTYVPTLHWPPVEPLMKTRWDGLSSSQVALCLQMPRELQLILSTGKKKADRSKGPRKSPEKSPECPRRSAPAADPLYKGDPLIPQPHPSSCALKLGSAVSDLTLSPHASTCLLLSDKKFSKYSEFGKASDHKQTLASSKKL